MKKLAFAALVLFGAVSTAHAAGNANAGQTKTVTCAACHGPAGNKTMLPAYPKLAGQHADYIAKQLADFKSGVRKDATMAGMSAGLSDEDMADLAAYFAAQTPSVGSANEEKAAAGKKIYQAGDKVKGVSACMACHGPSGAGNPGAKFPALSGQNSAYIVKALKDFRSGARDNDAGSMMRDIAAKMNDSEIDAVAEYISGLH